MVRNLRVTSNASSHLSPKSVSAFKISEESEVIPPAGVVKSLCEAVGVAVAVTVGVANSILVGRSVEEIVGIIVDRLVIITDDVEVNFKSVARGAVAFPDISEVFDFAYPEVLFSS